jgi:hypothetical protein
MGGLGNCSGNFGWLEQTIRAELLPDYVILLSGQDYPLRTPEEIDIFLTEHRGTSFTTFASCPTTPGTGMERWTG